MDSWQAEQSQSAASAGRPRFVFIPQFFLVGDLIAGAEMQIFLLIL